VLRAASDGARVSLQFAVDSAAASALAVGSAVNAIAEATGCALMVAGRLIAYVPNEIGRRMVYQARHAGSRQ
jgi:hypothetical protein